MSKTESEPIVPESIQEALLFILIDREFQRLTV